MQDGRDDSPLPQKEQHDTRDQAFADVLRTHTVYTPHIAQYRWDVRRTAQAAVRPMLIGPILWMFALRSLAALPCLRIARMPCVTQATYPKGIFSVPSVSRCDRTPFTTPWPLWIPCIRWPLTGGVGTHPEDPALAGASFRTAPFSVRRGRCVALGKPPNEQR